MKGSCFNRNRLMKPGSYPSQTLFKKVNITVSLQETTCANEAVEKN